MNTIDAFWAGAMDHGDGLDLGAIATRAGGWDTLIRGGADALVAAGVPVERARWWAATAPRHTRGTPLTLADARLPDVVRRMHTPPPVLCVEGDLAALQAPMVAIVGTRNCTRYGRAVARHLAVRLVEHGVTVVSGLARGIDGEAHRGALSAKGRTVAVVGHGLSHTAPWSHRGLRQEILDGGGAIVSSFPDDLPPRPHTFPLRNQWIAGLSAWTVVVEAGERSGALITARLALGEGREVAAVPGPVGAAESLGCLGLLRDGAHVVVDVPSFVAMVVGGAPRPTAAWLDDVFRGLPIDEVAKRNGWSSVDVIRALSKLEVEGAVVRTAACGYAPSGRPS